MGYNEFSTTSYARAKEKLGLSSMRHVTKRAEQKTKETGKLIASVDPAVDPIRRSLMRFDPDGEGHFAVTVGAPMAVETICDTTGSMGHNVDVMMKNLPDTYGLLKEVLPEFDVQLAAGIFGDVRDNFILQRPQFEMTAEKIVDYLASMAPERNGADWPEDPQYGLFAAAYLTDAYINRIGLKRYHFCVSDAPAHDCFDIATLERVFGERVLDYVCENIQAHRSTRSFTTVGIHSLSIADVVVDLSRLAFCFFLQVVDDTDTTEFWSEIYGRARVIKIPDTECLPRVQAAIVGLTEGAISIAQVKEWLIEHDIRSDLAQNLSDQFSRINLGAQAILRAQMSHPLPKPGDIYKTKTELWPMSAEEISADSKPSVEWL